MTLSAGCPLCGAPDAAAVLVVADTALYRVVRVIDAPDFPAYYRVVWRDHVVELSELDESSRAACMAAVVAVESVLRALSPTKINLAALGNVVPHLHWHVIARFDWDSHFPQSIWGPRQRDVDPSAAFRLAVPLDVLDQRIREGVAALGH